MSRAIPKTRKAPFNYYGGKSKLLNFILPLIATPHEIYCEPFCGSASVAFNKPLAKKSVCADLDSEVVNFFKLLRTRPDELVRVLELTPYHVDEFLDIRSADDKPDELERARRFFALIGMARGGLIKGAQFSRSSRVGGDKAATYRRKVESLPAFVERARSIEWDNCEYQSVFRRFDTPETLFFLDPPYLAETRNSLNAYKIDSAGEEFHTELLTAALALKGKVAISGYASELYDGMLAKWERHTFETIASTGGRPGQKLGKRTEVLWRNFKSEEEQPELHGAADDRP